MALMTRVVTGTVVAALVVVGGYAWADAHDIVPGVLTLGPEPSPPAPFPTAPGAALGPTPADTLAVLDPGAPEPSSDVLQKAATTLANDPALGTSVGVVVADALTGEVLASVSADTPRVPASIQKTLTAAAALSTLGPDTVLTTRVVRSGADRLVLVGGGDMMLSAGAGDPDAVNGRAGLADLARQTADALRLSGVTTVELDLDDTLFSGSRTGTWPEDVPSLGFAAPVSAVAVDTGRLTAGEYAPRDADPGLAATRTFADALAAEGVTVSRAPGRVTAPDDAPVLGSVDSAPLGDVVEYFLHTSDNTITEVVGRLVAVHAGLPGSFEGATRAVLQELGRLGIDTTGMVLVDCSGLADGSRVTASSFVEVLDLMADPARPALRLGLIGLPVGALDGTLAKRFVGTDAAGLVRAKTGSLPHVTSLAGTVMTGDDRQLTFVIMADETPDGGQWAPRQAMDRFVASLADCGCR